MKDADYMEIKSKWQCSNNVWKGNEPRGFYFILKNCVPELDRRQQDQTTWLTIQQGRQLVPLLLLIRQLLHNFDKLKHGVMATIETDMELYAGFMKNDEVVEEYLKLFQSRVDMILAHRGEPVHHRGLH